jgi:uncharacterized protein
MTSFEMTDRNRLRRKPGRAAYDRDTIWTVVDDALICHVGFIHEGQPFVIPTLHARREDEILLHGAASSRLIRHIAAGQPVCLTVTHIDGIVMAKTVFNHSINYRSAVIFGRGRLVDEPAEKLAALEQFTEKLLPGRWADVRPPNTIEMKATAIVAVAIESASAKIRQGGPKDDPPDTEWPAWAGVLPLQMVMAPPEPAAYNHAGQPLPGYITDYLARFSLPDGS